MKDFSSWGQDRITAVPTMLLQLSCRKRVEHKKHSSIYIAYLYAESCDVTCRHDLFGQERHKRSLIEDEALPAQSFPLRANGGAPWIQAAIDAENAARLAAATAVQNADSADVEGTEVTPAVEVTEVTPADAEVVAADADAELAGEKPTEPEIADEQLTEVLHANGGRKGRFL
jgi:hypothetical protein